MTPLPSPDASFARLVLDAPDADAGDPVNLVPRLQPAGLAAGAALPPGCAGRLTASGSAQFAAGGWRRLEDALTRRQPAALVVVDLRKESHGFLNGAAVSWYAAGSNWGAAGLSAADAIELERLRLALLAGAPQVPVATKALVQAQAPAGESWPVREVASERQVVEAGGRARYLRIGVDDHCAPDDHALAAMAELFEALPAGSHLHFHCRGGKGRTATALALLDIHQHAATLPLAAIVARQAALNGYALDREADPAEAKSVHLRARWEMLQRFHAACAARAVHGRG